MEFNKKVLDEAFAGMRAEPERVDMHRYGNVKESCGTVGCLAWWVCGTERFVNWADCFFEATNTLGITEELAWRLFCVQEWDEARQARYLSSLTHAHRVELIADQCEEVLGYRP